MSTTARIPVESWDIYGNWTVDKVNNDDEEDPMGIVVGSKFKIVDGFVLRKKHDINKVRWDSGALEIQLGEVTDSFRRDNGFVLAATILLNNVQQELLLGSDDGGRTLKVVVQKVGPSAQGGGSGGAGRP